MSNKHKCGEAKRAAMARADWEFGRLNRRAFVAAPLGALVAGCAPNELRSADAAAAFGALERDSGGTIGVCAIERSTGRRLTWRGDQFFGVCSSFKLSLAALVLRDIDRGNLAANEVLAYSADQLMAVSPVTRARVNEGGMSIVDLARAAQVSSDNLAANLLLRHLGGPSALTAFWRELGDSKSRIDAYEPAVNRVPLGTHENSTTPVGMGQTLDKLIYGDVLSGSSRLMLRTWMAQTETGLRRLRAAVPRVWWSGDKTGTGIYPDAPSIYIDLAVVEPPGRSELVIAAFFVSGAIEERVEQASEAVLRQVATTILQWSHASVSGGTTG